MGTCPKCKRKIRKNGNRVKLGSTWYHKVCPGRSASPGLATAPVREDSAKR